MKVIAGVTTKKFPLFLQNTNDLSLVKNQKKIKSLLPGKCFAYLHQVHGGKVTVLQAAEEFKKPGRFVFQQGYLQG